METRNFEAGAAASAPIAPVAPSNGYATNGSPATGTAATKPGAFWFHKIGEELRAIVTAGGITPSDADLAQVAKAIQGGKLMSGANTGTADALVAAFLLPVTTLVDGMSLSVRAAAANTGAATFTPNNGVIAVKAIVKGNNLPLIANDIAGAGHWIDLQYDATLDAWVMLNPANGIFASGKIMIVRDEKTANTAGGSSVTTAMPTAQTRALNTVASNNITGASLGSNRITLPAGTYLIEASAPCMASEHRIFLYSITASAIVAYGSSERGRVQTSTYATATRSFIKEKLTFAVTTVLELRHYATEADATYGLGFPTGSGNEIYSIVTVTAVGA